MKAQPLKNERKPIQPIRWSQPNGSFPYKVKDLDTWITVARVFAVKSPEYLIFYNFYVYLDVKHPNPRATCEVNWYLREYVGCNVTTDGGRNWAFSKSADPGIIYIPTKVMDFEGDGLVIAGSTGVGETISVPQYDDSNVMDTVSKGLDIYGMVELGLGVSEVALPLLIEGGLIVTGTAAAIVGPAVAVGSGHADALKSKSREHFFEGYSVGLVMSANGATKQYIKNRHELNHPPLDAVYPEKRETFRKLHNAGLELGIRQGKKFNTVDQRNLFTFLLSQLPASDREYFTPRIPWKEWSEAKRKDYYQKTSSIIKRKMLKNDLKLKIK
jgi:hypothetical protein